MIYVVSNQTKLPITTDPDIKYISIAEGLVGITQLGDIIGIDLETEGFDPYTKRILLLQIGNFFDQYVFDSTVDYKILISFFQDITKLFLFQNGKFDLRFLYHQKLYPARIYDTYLAEKLIYLGYPEGQIGMGLDAIADRYLGVFLDKSIRGQIHRVGATNEVIIYAANDVKYLPAIREKQLEKLTELELLQAIDIENEFVKVLAYTEYCGIKLDIDAWRAKMETDLLLFKEKQAALDAWVLSNGHSKYKNTTLQGDLFQYKDNNGFPTASCNIQWSSPKQVASFLEELGFDLMVKDKKTGDFKKSVEAGVIAKQMHVSDIAGPYLEYKSAEKDVTTYGESFISTLNPVTKRIHTQFTQLMRTGRLSSGGKDKDTNVTNINLQNLPSDEITRSCFIAESNNILVDADYSGQEQIVLANESLDSDLLHFYDANLGDMHSYVASKIFPYLKDTPLKVIKDKYKKERNISKTASFAINYGGDAMTISNNLSITLEEAKEIYDGFFNAFPGLKNYFQKVQEEAFKTGYIPICSLTGHKRFIPELEEFRGLKATFTKAFWEQYRIEKAANSQLFKQELSPKVRSYFKWRSSVEKMALNTPIQGTSAMITKIAGIKLFNYILANNLLHTVKIINFVHDEILIEVPITIQDRMVKVLKQCMELAGFIFCKRVPLVAKVEVSEHWVH